jgi:flagellar hook protein FlgE
VQTPGYRARDLVFDDHLRSTIGVNGAVTAAYSSGRRRVLDTSQLAVFNNLAGLLKIGNNHFRENASSGLSNIGNPNSGGRGSPMAGRSSRRTWIWRSSSRTCSSRAGGFQASARTITTASRMLEEAVNLVR